MGVILVGIRKENLVEMTAEIDLKTNGIYIVKNGQVQLIEPPQSGKVIRMEERKTRLL